MPRPRCAGNTASRGQHVIPHSKTVPDQHQSSSGSLCERPPGVGWTHTRSGEKRRGPESDPVSAGNVDARVPVDQHRSRRPEAQPQRHLPCFCVLQVCVWYLAASPTGSAGAATWPRCHSACSSPWSAAADGQTTNCGLRRIRANRVTHWNTPDRTGRIRRDVPPRRAAYSCLCDASFHVF